MPIKLELTDKGRWIMQRVRQLKMEGMTVEGAFDLANSEADLLFPAEGEHA